MNTIVKCSADCVRQVDNTCTRGAINLEVMCSCVVCINYEDAKEVKK